MGIKSKITDIKVLAILLNSLPKPYVYLSVENNSKAIKNLT